MRERNIMVINFDEIKELHGVDFIIPKYAEYATALGAALSLPELEKEKK